MNKHVYHETKHTRLSWSKRLAECNICYLHHKKRLTSKTPIKITVNVSREVFETHCNIGTFRGSSSMPWIKVSSETHKAMKEYLVDVEGLTLGELVEDAFCFAMENLPDFEEAIGLGEEEEGESEEETEEEEQSEEWGVIMGKAEKDKCDLEEQAKEDQRRMEEQRQIMKAWREQGIFYAWKLTGLTQRGWKHGYRRN
jgi:hypothetical protein